MSDLTEKIARELSKIDVIWHDQLTPGIALAIWQAALSQQQAQSTMLRKPTIITPDERDMLKNATCFANDGAERDWSELEPAQPSCEPVRIEFGKGLIGVHTVMMSERKAIALTNLGVGKVGAPTLHPNGTACESIIVEMDFGNAESCQVLIDELSGLFHDRISCEPMAWYLPDVKMVTTSEVERDRWLSAGHIVISLYPI